MIKKISCLILAIALFLINTNIIYALEIYENDGYNIYFNSIKSNAKYKVAAIVGEGDRIFYDLDGITQILKSKGGTSINVYKLGESLDEDAVKTSISKISSELGETIEDNNIQALTDYTGIKEKDTIAIATKLNNNLIYGITNEIGTKKFIPFAIIKYNIYVEEDSDVDEEQYETILFSKVDIGSDVESYVEEGKVYYPIRFVSKLLGGDINIFYRGETGRDKTGISVNFDIKEKYKIEKTFSNKEDEKNNTLSKNQCLSVKIKQQVENKENIVNGRIYNLDNNELILVQNANLDKIIKDNDELEVFKEKSNTISICNIEEKIDIEDIQFDVFIGSDKENFVPTNLTIKEDNVVIKNNDSISINPSYDSKITNITFKKSNDTTISLDKEFEINTKEYQTNETLSNSIENVYYTIEYENGKTSDGYVYLEPKKKNTTVKISDYTFVILRNEKDSNTKLKGIKYKKTSDTEWIDLAINAEGKYTIENALYSDYELLLQTYKETSSVTVESGTVTKVDDGYKLIPNSNIQTFNVVAEDGTSIKYSVTFNEEVEKETITSVEVEQGETKYTAKGPDENNQFTVEEFDKSKGEGVKIKYKTSSGEDKEVSFEPNDSNKNVGTLYVKNNVYTILFKEKESVPQEESKETITSLEVYQEGAKLTVTGPDSNNQYTVEEFDKSKGEVLIRYKTSAGKTEDEYFEPNDNNKNTGTIYAGDTTYKIVFKISDKPKKFIFTGDSRTVGIKNAVGNPENVSFVAAGGMGHQWFVNNGISQINNILNSSKESHYIFFNFGVNDAIDMDTYNGYKAWTWRVNKYLTTLKELSSGAWKNHKIVYISVLPLASYADTPYKNDGVIDLNMQIKNGLAGTNISFCDVTKGIGESNFKYWPDGIHYTNDMNKVIYDYIMNNCKL